MAHDRDGRNDDDATRRNAEHDRLLHRRKGLGGSEFAGIGVQFAVTIVVFAFAGVWLDRWLGTSPLFVLVLVFGGAGLGFWSMVRKAR
ncbi:MAG: AtpZ/AtpI family protein [Gemmatimonadaceae bacterium]